MNDRLLLLKREICDIIDELGQAKKTVLVVEEQDRYRGELRHFLQSLGYVCREADSARKALDRLQRTTHIAVVILDVVMQGANGLKLLRTIKRRYPDVDVLAIIGNPDEHRPTQVVQTGASDFLARPFRGEDLSARLHRILRDRTVKTKHRALVATDGLTGLYNSRYFYRKLRREMERTKRQGRPLSILVISIDGLESFNGRYGRLRGAAVLKALAATLRLSIREHVDCAFRYRENRFIIILPEADDERAAFIGNRISTRFKDMAPPGLNLKIEVVEYRKDFGREALVHLVTRGAPRHQQELEPPGQAPPGKDDQNQTGKFRCLTCGKPLHHASCFCESCLTDSETKPVSA